MHARQRLAQRAHRCGPDPYKAAAVRNGFTTTGHNMLAWLLLTAATQSMGCSENGVVDRRTVPIAAQVLTHLHMPPAPSVAGLLPCKWGVHKVPFSVRNLLIRHSLHVM